MCRFGSLSGRVSGPSCLEQLLHFSRSSELLGHLPQHQLVEVFGYDMMRLGWLCVACVCGTTAGVVLMMFGRPSSKKPSGPQLANERMAADCYDESFQYFF